LLDVAESTGARGGTGGQVDGDRPGKGRRCRIVQDVAARAAIDRAADVARAVEGEAVSARSPRDVFDGGEDKRATAVEYVAAAQGGDAPGVRAVRPRQRVAAVLAVDRDWLAGSCAQDSDLIVAGAGIDGERGYRTLVVGGRDPVDGDG